MRFFDRSESIFLLSTPHYLMDTAGTQKVNKQKRTTRYNLSSYQKMFCYYKAIMYRANFNMHQQEFLCIWLRGMQSVYYRHTFFFFIEHYRNLSKTFYKNIKNDRQDFILTKKTKGFMKGIFIYKHHVLVLKFTYMISESFVYTVLSYLSLLLN